jgi:hypothetical protein
MSRKVIAVLLVSAAAGCSGPGSKPPETIKVEIFSPQDAQTLRIQDDTDLAKAGLQIAVTAVVTGPASGAAELGVDGAPAGSADLSAEGKVTFSGVTVVGGSHILSVTARGGGTSGSSSVQVKVEEVPANPTVEITAPAAGVLNKTADQDKTQPGLQTSVKLKLSGVSGGMLRLCSTVGPASGAACAKAAGRVLAEKKVGREVGAEVAVTLPEGKVDLSAEVKDDFSGGLAATAAVSYTVDSVEPTLAFLLPAAGDLVSRNPFPVLLRTDAEQGQVVTVSGGTSLVTGKVDSRGEVQVNITSLEGTVKLKADVIDLAGNAAKTAETSFSVDTNACNLSIKSPAALSVLFNGSQDNDKNPANGLQTDVVANTTDCKGRKAEIYVQNVKKASATADLTTGDLTFKDVELKDKDKDVSVEVRLTDAAGNTAKTSFLASVLLKGPDLSLSTEPSPRNLINDGDYGTPGIQTKAQVGASTLQGGNIYLCSTIANSASPTACKKGGSVVSSVLKHTAAVTAFFGLSLGDGAQTLTAEVEDGAGNISVSNGVAVTIDGVAPKIEEFAIREDKNSDGLLSAKELPATAKATLDLKVTGADGQSLSIVSKDGSGTALGSEKVVGATKGVVSLSLALSDGSDTLLAKVTSANGNPNISATPVITDTKAHLAYTVDRTPPLLNVLAPTKALLNKADDGIAATDDIDLDLEVATDAPSGATVSFTIDSATTPKTSIVSQGKAKLPVTLGQGAHAIDVRVSDPAGNESTRRITFNVDTLAPKLTIDSPAAGAKFTSYQVPVSVTAAGAEAGQVVTLESSATGVIGTQAVDSSGKASLTVTVPNGAQTLTAKVSDRAGNAATPATVSIEVASKGCQLAVSQPATLSAKYSLKDDKNQDPNDGLQVDVVATTSDCKGRTADLVVSGTKIDTVTADASTGQILFKNVKFSDGAASVPVSIKTVDAGGISSEFSFTVSVKLAQPAFQTLTPARPAAGTLTFVAKGNPKIDGTTVIQDPIDGGDADAQFAVKVSGAPGGTLSIKIGTTEIVNKGITSDPEDFGTFNVTLPQNTSSALKVTATDAFGNAATVSYNLVVDVIAPDAPTVTRTDIADNRTASVLLEWTSTGDDASTGSNAGYDIRYLTSSTAGTSFSCPTLNDAAFATAAKLSNPPAGGVAGVKVSFTGTGLPPLNCYALAVRTVDEVGNLSPLTNVVTKANYWTETTVSGPSGGAVFGALLANGDIDGNGAQDLVVTAFREAPAGAVYVYYGGSVPAAASQALNSATVLFPGANPARSGLVAGETFGLSATVGDVDGDGADDVAVGATSFGRTDIGTNLGRVFLFFGKKTGQIDPQAFVEIRGRTVGGRFGQGLKVIDDINKDGMKELLVGARTDGAAGYSFLFLGRSQSQWRADRTSIDLVMSPVTPFLSAANASRVFVGVSGDDFGNREGFTSLGDLDGDGRAELAIPASKDTVNKVYLYNAATVMAASQTQDIGPASASVLTPPQITKTTGGQEGFGATAIGGLDFDGDSYPDLIVSHPIVNLVRLYKGDPVAKAIGALVGNPLARGSDSIFFGQSMSAGDLNGDGKPDLVVGNSSNNASFAGASTVLVYYNAGTSLPFDSAGTVLKTGTLYSRVRAADFNGDGKIDLAVADPLDGTGKVHFYAP